MKAIPLIWALVTPALRAQPMIDVCIDYHCDTRQQVELSPADWRFIVAPLRTPAASAEDERGQIREAIARFEQVVGQYTPTGSDRPGNAGEDRVGQLDCIAESTNARRYLQALEQRGRLRWHMVEQRIRRAPYLFDTHWGVLLTERATQQGYVLDSWYGSNGDLPDIRTADDWLDKRGEP